MSRTLNARVCDRQVRRANLVPIDEPRRCSASRVRSDQVRRLSIRQEDRHGDHRLGLDGKIQGIGNCESCIRNNDGCIPAESDRLKSLGLNC